MDNGPELTSKAMFFWSKRTGVTLHFIQPPKPTQNAFVESFTGKFRNYCLNGHIASAGHTPQTKKGPSRDPCEMRSIDEVGRTPDGREVCRKARPIAHVS